MQIKSQMMSVPREWGDGSAGKVLAAKSREAEFGSTTLTERPREAVSFSDPSSEGQGTDKSQGPSQFSAKHKPQGYPGKASLFKMHTAIWSHPWGFDSPIYEHVLFINLIYFFSFCVYGV